MQFVCATICAGLTVCVDVVVSDCLAVCQAAVSLSVRRAALRLFDEPRVRPSSSSWAVQLYVLLSSSSVAAISLFTTF